jgi:hypothetical protein
VTDGITRAADRVGARGREHDLKSVTSATGEGVCAKGTSETAETACCLGEGHF